MSKTTEWVPKGREYSEKGTSLAVSLARVEQAVMGLEELIDILEVQLVKAGIRSVRDVAIKSSQHGLSGRYDRSSSRSGSRTDEIE